MKFKDVALLGLLVFNAYMVAMFYQQRNNVKDFETQVQFYIAELERERGCTDQVLAVEKKTESTINKQNNMIDGFIRLIQAVKEMEDEKDSDNS
jgi:hypothetical protein